MVIAAENNPINQYERFFDISLLIEHGTNDETISIAGDQALYDRLISDGHPNAVFFKDDSVHQIPSGFVPTLMRTFQDYLK
ncbi:MAG: hypothetical protein EOM64_10910 [Erysipelotrichia bacterium]|nr:hypothetical protein [Erysipelotrichia bacterium]